MFFRNLFVLKRYSSVGTIKSWLKNSGEGSIYLNALNDEVTKLVIHNPQFHNAITGEMMSKLDDCLYQLKNDPPKVVILSSECGNFCSGAHLNFVESISNPLDGEKMCKFMQFVTKEIVNLPSLTVALIEGVAYGGGAELILCCDLRFIAFDGKISFKQRKMGITPAWGGCHRLIQLIGKQKTMRLLFSTEILSPTIALEMGLVDKILSSDNSEKRLTECLDNLGNMIDEVSKDLLFAIKKVVVEISNIKSNRAMDIERHVLKTVWGNKDHLDALKNLK